MDGSLIYLGMDNAKVIISILKAVHFRDLATIFATNNGIKVTVEDSKCIQGNAFLHSALFREYSVKKDIISFRTNLGILIDCLSIFGTSVQGSPVSLILSYKTHGSALNILLEENAVVAECNIKTMEAFEILDFDFCSSNISDKFIMKPECMREAFNELDTSSEILEVAIIPPPAVQSRLRLTTYGFSGTMHFDIPRSSDQVEVFESATASPRIARFRLSLLRLATSRALSMASRISLRINDRGFLSIQYMINISDGEVAFVEFFCVPDVDESDQSESQPSTNSSQNNISKSSKMSYLVESTSKYPANGLNPDWSD
ncbi:Cell cycle checkpoint protein [Schistosoma japonicum]|uniref:Cell cycle checkpoint protein n=2 Tax=Schistosoma japonicum TaxID=6182 RepID=A0A4Z2DLT7_SCHJA|nr:Cell cycle checkpoint protein [Schistosoma japonicum]